MGMVEQSETNVCWAICKYQRGVKSIQKQKSAFSQEGNAHTGLPAAWPLLTAFLLQLPAPLLTVQCDQTALLSSQECWRKGFHTFLSVMAQLSQSLS